MDSSFLYPSYFKAYIKASNFVDPDDIKSQIHDAVNPFFTLTDVTFDEFVDQYKFNASRITLLEFPSLIVNVVQGIYHLALSIITFSKVTYYTALRDFEEAYGRGVGFTNEKKGAFHVERAIFHKYTYDLYLNRPNYSIKVIGGREVPYSFDAERTPFSTFLKNPSFHIQKFKLEKEIGDAFVEKLRTLDKELLELPIIEFIKNPQFISKFIFISDEEYNAIPLADFSSLNDEEVKILQFRHKQLKGIPADKADISDWLKLPNKFYFMIPDGLIDQIDFTQMEAESIHVLLNGRINPKWAAKIPIDKLRKNSDFLIFLSMDQVKELKNPTFEELNIVVNAGFLRLLSKEQIQPHLTKFDSSLCYHLSHKQIRELDFSKITRHQFGYIFDDEVLAERIKLLNSSQIEGVAKYLKSTHSNLISDEIIKKIDFSKLIAAEETLNILHRFDEEKMKHRLDLLEPKQLHAALRHLSIGFVNLISDDQIKKLPFDELDYYDLSKIFANQRAKLLNDAQWKSCISRLDIALIQYIPEHIVLNNIDDFSDAQLSFISSHRKNVFSKIPEDKRKTILDKISQNI